MADDQEKELFRSIFTYGESALRSVILINGGGAVALLAFIGNVMAKGADRSIVAKLSVPLAMYVFGVLAASLATGASYVTQYAYVHHSENKGLFWHVVSVVLVVASYALFAVGSWQAFAIFRTVT